MMEATKAALKGWRRSKTDQKRSTGNISPLVGSKFVFLLPQKLPGCLRHRGKLAFYARWLQKGIG
jgi:hypothetical protein